MAIKAKSSGTRADSSAGLFDSRLRKGQATGLSRGTASISSGTIITVNKQKYKLNRRGESGYH